VAVMRELRRSVTARPPREASPQEAPAQVGGPRGRRAWEWARSLLIAFGLFLIVRTFLVEAFRIPTGSMEPTLLVGDFLIVNKAAFGAAIPGTAVRAPALSDLRRGDVIVFVPPHERDRNYVKRLIGMPGDTLEMLEKVLYLNGLPQDEPYARYHDAHDSYSPGMTWQCSHSIRSGDCRPTRDSWGPLEVPADRYLVLGDHRDDSEDSRYWGFVHRESIRGRPLFIYYSFEPRAPGAFPWLTAIRWERVGERIH
jgi:signal peptidase I